MAVADVLRWALQIYGISVAFFTGMLYCERDMEFWEEELVFRLCLDLAGADGDGHGG